MMSRNRRKKGKHLLAALLFCLVMSMTMVCLADEKGTIKVESAKIREKADASSNPLGSAAQGGTVDIIGETTGADGQKWYQVYVNATTKGYIRADLVDRSGSSSLPTVDASTDTGASLNSGASTATDTGASASVTPIEPKVGTVKSSSVNVRRSASTNSASIATVRSGVVLTVTGETTGADAKQWYQVTFKHNDKNIEGFIRADLVTFDNVPADAAASTEITGSENAEGQTVPEPETRQEEPEQQPEPEDNSGSDANENVIFMNVEEVPYILPGFEYVKLDWNGQKINAYRNGTSFFIVYAQRQNGEEGWYLLDRDRNVYQRYPYTAENVTVPDTGILGTSPVLLIAAGAVVLILIIIIVFLLVRLKGNDGYYEEYDDDDDDYPEEDDEIEELDEIDEEPIRRPVPQKTNSQPVRRSGSQSGAPQGQGGQPPRRPTPQGGASQGQGGQAPRRPVSQQGAPQGQNNGQAPRRPAPQGQGGQPPRRPVPQGGAPQGQKRPNPQNNRPAQNVASQRGQKAKTFLDNEDDDMDFIDI